MIYLARKCNLESYYHINQVYIISNANLYSHIYYKILLSSKQKYQLSESAGERENERLENSVLKYIYQDITHTDLSSSGLTVP